MRRIILLILIFVAVPLYVWNALQVLGVSFLRHGQPAVHAAAATPSSPKMTAEALVPRTVTFAVNGRDPFRPYPAAATARPASTGAAGAASPARAPATPPPVTINSIMWNAASPVAILALGDGSTTVAGPGQRVNDDIVVKKVDQTRVLISYKGRDVWIVKQ